MKRSSLFLTVALVTLLVGHGHAVEEDKYIPLKEIIALIQKQASPVQFEPLFTAKGKSERVKGYSTRNFERISFARLAADGLELIEGTYSPKVNLPVAEHGYPVLYGTMPDAKLLLKAKTLDEVYQVIVPEDSTMKERQMRLLKTVNAYDQQLKKLRTQDLSKQTFNVRAVYHWKRRLSFVTLTLHLSETNEDAVNVSLALWTTQSFDEPQASG